MSDRSTSTRSRLSPAAGRSFARAQIYGLLAHVLTYPGDEQAERVAVFAPRAGAAAEYLHAPEADVGRLLDALAATSREDLRQAYRECFTLTYSPDVPAYETAYVTADVFRQTQEMADVAGFYRAFGVEVGGDDHERVDHIAVELSFMQVLCLKEAYAAQHRDREGLRVCRDAQRSFLRDHLLCWGPAFGARLSAVAGPSAYGEAGRLLQAWLQREAAWLKVEARRVYDRPVPPPEPPREDDETIPLVDISGEEAER